MGDNLLSTSKMENRLCTGSGGARFTHCGLQNPLFLPLMLPPLWFLPQFLLIRRLIGPPVPATQAAVPTTLPRSSSECQTTRGTLWHNVLVSCIEDTLLVV